MPEDLKANEQRALEALSTKLAKQLDDAIIEALRRHLKRPIAGPGELARLAQRVNPVAVQGEPGTTYWLDDTPLVWVGAAEVGEADGKIRASQELRQLLPDF